MASAPDPAPVDLFLNPTLSKQSNGELMDLPGTLALITRLMLLGSQSLSGVGGKSVRVNNLRAANYICHYPMHSGRVMTNAGWSIVGREPHRTTH